MVAKIVTYAVIVSISFVACELFIAFYTRVPEHALHFDYRFTGPGGHAKLVPWMWISVMLALIAAVLLINPKTRNNETLLPLACACVFFSVWLEKGIILLLTGFVP